MYMGSLLQLRDLGTAHHTAQRQDTLGDGHLNGLDEATSADDLMAAGFCTDGGTIAHAHHTLQRKAPNGTHHSQCMYTLHNRLGGVSHGTVICTFKVY